MMGFMQNRIDRAMVKSSMNPVNEEIRKQEEAYDGKDGKQNSPVLNPVIQPRISPHLAKEKWATDNCGFHQNGV